MKSILNIFCFLVTIALVFVFAFLCGRQGRRFPEPFKRGGVPTFIELQNMVGAEPDGIIGPNTIARWEREICNQYAREAMARMAGEKE